MLAQPWASVVLSGAVTRPQLDANLAALTVGQLPALSLAEAPDAYWAEKGGEALALSRKGPDDRPGTSQGPCAGVAGRPPPPLCKSGSGTAG